MLLLFLYLFIALFFSFLCSILEASLLSITPAYIGSKINEGKSYATSLKRLKMQIDLPLSAILTLNTFAHTLGAAGVGAQAQKIWGNQYLSLVSGGLTLIILIFSEIIPKTLGATYWKRLAKFTTISLKILIYSPLYPFIYLSKFITQLLNPNKEESFLSLAEFQAIAERGIKEGLFVEEESKILMNLLRFNRITARDIMTPRTILIAAEETLSIEDFYNHTSELNVSRIPVYDETIDNITGYVLKDELLQNIINNAGSNSLKQIRREIITVNEKMPIIKLFNKLIVAKEHIAILVGEYGETAGIVTTEDIIETLLGIEIMDEQDNIEDMQKQARRNWESRAKRMGLLEK